MIKIEIENIDQVANEFVSILWNKMERNRLKDFKYKNDFELLDKIKRLYSIKPSELLKENQKFCAFVDEKRYDKSEIEKFFTYEKSITWAVEDTTLGYWLASKLNINTCPYCNRQYTFTIDNTKKIRPQFDHFHPKKEYQYLSLSFYNLIPCCSICNLAKKDSEISINPYLSSFEENECNFEITNMVGCLLSNNDPVPKYEIDFTADNNNISAFALKQLYDKHSDYLSELIFKVRSYNEGYYDSLKETFLDLEMSNSEMNLLIFGNYLETSKHKDRPLSKLTSDIINQLGIKK